MTLGGTDVIPPTPESEASLTGSDSDSDTLIAVPGRAAARQRHAERLGDRAPGRRHRLRAQPTSMAGPYNAQALGQVEALDVLVDVPTEDIPLVEAELITGEAVAECVGDTVEYAASSDATSSWTSPAKGALGDLTEEVVDRSSRVSPGRPDRELRAGRADAAGRRPGRRRPRGDRLEAADPEVGLVQVRLGHAELSGVTCGDAGGGDTPECSDATDNDGDEVIDADDPGCHTDGNPDNPDSYDPEDDDEGDDGGPPECSDGTDNDGDGVTDIDDPGCHTDGNPDNPDSYDPTDDDEGPQCSDGVDNDADGTTDLADPGCEGADDETESPNPAEPRAAEHGRRGAGRRRGDVRPGRLGAPRPPSPGGVISEG